VVEFRLNRQTVSPITSPGEYKRGVVWTRNSNFAFCEITLVFRHFSEQINKQMID